MVIKEGKVIAVGMLTALLLAVANGAYFFTKNGSSVGLMSGNSIKDVVTGFYRTSSMNQRIFILFQFILLILAVVVVIVIIKKVKSKAGVLKKGFVNQRRTGSGTDIDILYEMLKKDTEVSIIDIGKLFDVTPEVALEWAKVLENGNLATIEYPRFGKPVLRLFVKEADKEGKEIEKDKNVDKKKIEEEKDKHELQKVAVEKVVLDKVSEKSKEKEGRKVDKKIKKIDKKIKKASKRVEKKTIKVNKISKKIKKRTAKMEKKSKAVKKKKAKKK